jgi:SagB-type dehydrogenase family enzyme
MRRRTARPAAAQFRRSPHIVSYWSDGRLVFHNFATGKRVAGSALIIGLLDYFHDWRPSAPLFRQSTLPAAKLQTAVDRLVRASLLQRADAPLPRAEAAMTGWADWNPAAGFFHFSTKDHAYETDEDKVTAALAARVRSRPVPASAKRYAGLPRVKLPPAAVDDPFARVLLARRTWRRFGKGPLTAGALSALLGLTFDAQRFMDLGLLGRAMLRTSPSAGACHPLEAYVVVRRVAGVPSGIYHYAPVRRELVRLKRTSRPAIGRYLAGQSWYGEASILVLITAVFARTSWKYAFPRAYRTVLLEAGHFCQTFCLVATALGLAPFCSAALADSLIERDLGIDGVRESVLYACGVGTRPPGVDWAPWPRNE